MSHFSLLEQLLQDEQFIAWVRAGSSEEDVYWQRLSAEHPGQVETIEEAKRCLIELSHWRHALPEDRSNKLRQRVLQNTLSEETAPQSVKTKSIPYIFQRAAAVLLLIGLGGWIAWWLSGVDHNTATYRTSYGEIKVVTLPDSSLVTLNANSTLKYRYNDSENRREVWLTGEGFFDIRKREVRSKSNQRSRSVSFWVHADQVSVQVLGTRFNVKHRGEKTQVVLEEGSVQLSVNEQNKPLLMQPDELVEVQQRSGKLKQQPVEALNYSIWKEGMLRFEGATFDEISRVLVENYGIELRFADPKKSAQIRLRGVFPAENIDLLLEAIANVSHTDMRRQDTVVEFE